MGLTDYDGTPLDPTEQHVDIFDSQKNLVTTITERAKFTKTDTGKYFFYYPIPADAIRGTWTLIWYATYNGITTNESFDFEVGVAP